MGTKSAHRPAMAANLSKVSTATSARAGTPAGEERFPLVASIHEEVEATPSKQMQLSVTKGSSKKYQEKEQEEQGKFGESSRTGLHKPALKIKNMKQSRKFGKTSLHKPSV